MDESQTERETEEKQQPIGIYGWRKRCLYSFILLLTIMTVLNLALLVWILRVLNFDVDGMKSMKFTSDGMTVDGEVEFLNSLYTENIKSLQSMPLKIDSSRGVHIRARNENSQITNTFTIANKTVTSQSESFTVKNSRGMTKLAVSDKGVDFVNADVTFSGSTSKVHVTGSIATPNVRGPIAEPLRVEALSTQLNVIGEKGVVVSAPAGRVLVKSADRLSFVTDKNIYMGAKNYYIKNLQVSSGQSGGGVYSGTVYELCICDTGKLFLSRPSDNCAASDTVCL